MTLTDLITSLLSIYLIALGASRGFLRSLLGPVSLVVGTVVSIVYYNCTKQLIVSLIIGLAGPFILLLILKFLLRTWVSVTKSTDKPDFLSRTGGLVLTLFWGWVFVVFTLILLAAFPPLNEPLKFIHHDVTSSVSYSVAKPLEDIFFQSPQKIPAAGPVRAHAAGSAANPSGEAKSLADDPRFQKVLQDPEVQKEIREHDYVKLMQNPKMLALTQQIMNDPAAMKKVLSVYKTQRQAAGTAATTPENK
jgi:uncharacterized membrane protein required for colicin V production